MPLQRHHYETIAGGATIVMLVLIGLWANTTFYGDPIASVSEIGDTTESISILAMSLFVGLSMGHYMGNSFEHESNLKYFAIGANCVLSLVLFGFIGYQVVEGGEIITPVVFAGMLIAGFVALFTAHRAGIVQEETKLEEWIEGFSSKGTAAVVVSTFIIRTVPDPGEAIMWLILIVVFGLFLWHLIDVPQLRERVDELIQDLLESKDDESGSADSDDSSPEE